MASCFRCMTLFEGMSVGDAMKRIQEAYVRTRRLSQGLTNLGVDVSTCCVRRGFIIPTQNLRFVNRSVGAIFWVRRRLRFLTFVCLFVC